ncbi:hypothetical protein [Micromonospora purpureochromogenes]|uniref:Uncharacterized protein n=1 Tax=Micromonospora purpureochromogenes TaxID=47872 RepID=A0ABX2RK10_9ACTN|nr:hypothetical protein [Micromonospora purpureochromogenes]NYF56485.1 hypothetical protein [Micromonospora purpureochromogenes]
MPLRAITAPDHVALLTLLILLAPLSLVPLLSLLALALLPLLALPPLVLLTMLVLLLAFPALADTPAPRSAGPTSNGPGPAALPESVRGTHTVAEAADLRRHQAWIYVMLTSEEASYASGLRVAVTGGQPIL